MRQWRCCCFWAFLVWYRSSSCILRFLCGYISPLWIHKLPTHNPTDTFKYLRNRTLQQNYSCNLSSLQLWSPKSFLVGEGSLSLRSKTQMHKFDGISWWFHESLNSPWQMPCRVTRWARFHKVYWVINGISLVPTTPHRGKGPAASLVASGMNE